MKSPAIRFQLSELHLTDWALLKATGREAIQFFQGQITNDLNSAPEKTAILSARLNRAGKVQSFFYIGKNQSEVFLLCPVELVLAIKADFEKYIVMEDVTLSIVNKDLWLVFNPHLLNEPSPAMLFALNFYGISAELRTNSSRLPQSDLKELEEVRILNGWPKWNSDVTSDQLINESMLNEYAISYKKGCFLGQETAAKIENNRGAAFYPVLIELIRPLDLSAYLKQDLVEAESDKKAGTLLYQVGNYLQVRLRRELRVLEKKLQLKIGDFLIEGKVKKLPYFSGSSKEDLALELYHLGIKNFHENSLEEAKRCFEMALLFNPNLSDAYESMGVVLGREGKFQEAISWMDRLLLVNCNSVMAHTNKSLFLMKLGLIEEAEKEKSLATIKSFAYHGEEAKIKKQLQEEEEKKARELARREEMFKQVLELDPDDSIALYGMADIFFHRKDYASAIKNLKKVLELNPAYSVAYLLLGKCYEALDDKNEALLIYQAGVTAASKKGDMMPANEMQSRLNQLL